ncbi:putative nucleic-acid-binding Zn-ribbon protein [Chryseobacterium rhizosphaerae]|uniref:hypothetical protein n=1 Tax=Chryseobacterium rhizosphaerae TaxID=395937 RepID=UPI0028675763|nr:hypothetical protein [Chryseobacterium rhizosphaerae]MDR6548488.1 putative nucleic-acid-binding Zn-ribbon protein [Chryseobacterium rhizosphaerae]
MDIDLFEHLDQLPPEVQKIIEDYGETESLEYSELEFFLKRIEAVGYTFEYGLDAIPFNLTKLINPNPMQKFTTQAQSLREKAVTELRKINETYREKSDHFEGSVIRITDNKIQYHLEGERYLSEIDIQNKKLIDNNGYQYDLDILSDHQLFTIIDTIEANIEKYQEWQESQSEIFYKIQNAGFNIVTCGNCGEVILHEIHEEGEIHCGGCSRDMDKSDCPDLYS